MKKPKNRLISQNKHCLWPLVSLHCCSSVCMFHFHLAAFMIFSFAFDFWQFNYDVFQHGFLGLYLVWGWLNVLNLKLMSFTNFGEFSVIISSNVSSCSNRFPRSFWDLNHTRSPRLCVFLNPSFLFLCLQKRERLLPYLHGH